MNTQRFIMREQLPQVWRPRSPVTCKPAAQERRRRRPVPVHSPEARERQRPRTGDGRAGSSREQTGPPSASRPGQAAGRRRDAHPHRPAPSSGLRSLIPKSVSSRNTRTDTPRPAVLPVSWAPLGAAEWAHKVNHHGRQWVEEAAAFRRVAKISSDVQPRQTPRFSK